MKDTVMDAGTIVLLLATLFAALVALATFLSVSGFAPPLATQIVEWAGAAFVALLTALGIQRGRRRGDGDD